MTATACRGKVPYTTEGAARQSARQLSRHKGGGHFSIYRCLECRGWHVGNKTKTLKSKLVAGMRTRDGQRIWDGRRWQPAPAA